MLHKPIKPKYILLNKNKTFHSEKSVAFNPKLITNWSAPISCLNNFL